MPRTPATTDRFDELPVEEKRVGAHRAENPRMRPAVILVWSALATIALVAMGIFGTLIATGRVTLFPAASPSATPPPVTASPVVDTSFAVIVLNATPEEGLANSVRDDVVAAGWSADSVTEGDSGSTDFETTTVYYARDEDEGAARGLAQKIGGAEVAFSTAYQYDDTLQLVIVIGLDRTASAGDE